MGSDDLIDEKCFYMTLAANIRRREMHVLPRYKQKKTEKTKLSKRKSKEVLRKEPIANLKKFGRWSTMMKEELS